MSELGSAGIKQTRENLGITQTELAEAIDASRRTVIAWESGESKPSGRYRARLERYFEELTRKASPAKPEETLLLRDADFAQTLQHLADLYRAAQA